MRKITRIKLASSARIAIPPLDQYLNKQLAWSAVENGNRAPFGESPKHYFAPLGKKQTTIIRPYDCPYVFNPRRSTDAHLPDRT